MIRVNGHGARHAAVRKRGKPDSKAGNSKSIIQTQTCYVRHFFLSFNMQMSHLKANPHVKHHPQVNVKKVQLPAAKAQQAVENLVVNYSNITVYSNEGVLPQIRKSCFVYVVAVLSHSNKKISL
jgi:hypothetical protein